MKKTFKILIVLVLIFMASAAAALFINFESSLLRDVIKENIEKSTGRKIVIGKVFIKIIEGVKVEGFSMSNAEGFSKEPFLKLEEMVLKYELFPILSRKIKIKEIVFQKPSVLIEKNASGTYNFSDLIKDTDEASEAEIPDDSFFKEISLDVSVFKIIGGSAVYNDFSGEPVSGRFEGINLNINDFSVLSSNPEKIIESIMFKGDLAVGSAEYDGYKGEITPSPFNFKEGVFTAGDFKIKAYDGFMKAAVSADLNKKIAVYKLSTVAENLNLNRLLTEKGWADGTLLGSLESAGSFWGEASGINGLNGEGSVELAPGRFKNISIIEKTADFLRMETLRNMQYSAALADYTIENGVVDIKSASAAGAGFKINLTGKINLPDDALDCVLNFQFAPSLANDIALAGISALPKDSGGNLSLELAVTGSLKKPKIDYSRIFKSKFAGLAQKDRIRDIKEKVSEEASQKAEELKEEAGEFLERFKR